MTLRERLRDALSLSKSGKGSPACEALMFLTDAELDEIVEIVAGVCEAEIRTQLEVFGVS